MRVKLREIVDASAPVDLDSLTPLQKLTVGIKRRIYEYDFYKRRQDRKAEAESRARAEREDFLKGALLTHAHIQLVENREMSLMGSKCIAINVIVPRSYEKDLRNIVWHKDFLSYEIKIFDCDPDLLLSYPDLPIIVGMKIKGVGGGSGVEKTVSFM
jgi:hypothetical protein